MISNTIFYFKIIFTNINYQNLIWRLHDFWKKKNRQKTGASAKENPLISWREMNKHLMSTVTFITYDGMWCVNMWTITLCIITVNMSYPSLTTYITLSKKKLFYLQLFLNCFFTYFYIKSIKWKISITFLFI